MATGNTIAQTPSWEALKAHAVSISDYHLRDLIGDAERCSALTTEACGFVLDYSRQNANAATKDLLLALARESSLEEKIASMFDGSKINVRIYC